MFVIGTFTDTMRRLVLRSNKSELHSTRVEVLFINVLQLDIPTVMHGIQIANITGTEEGDDFLDEKQVVSFAGSPHSVFLIRSDRVDGHLISGNFDTREDQGEPWEQSGFDLTI